MVIFESLSQLKAASKKAFKVKPKIYLREFGVYEITGSKNDIYTVRYKIDGLGNRLIFCTCEDKWPRKLNQACYHIAASFALHLYLCHGRVLYFGADQCQAGEGEWLRMTL